MSTTTYESLTPELRLALRAACEVPDPVLRGQRRAQHWQLRLTQALCALACLIGLYDAALLMAAG